jgi:hypothetical protein
MSIVRIAAALISAAFLYPIAHELLGLFGAMLAEARVVGPRAINIFESLFDGTLGLEFFLPQE